jgi:hypothetical protein
MEFSQGEVHTREAQAPNETWKLPETNFIKVNFDAAYCQETHKGVWDFIAWADDGSFIVAGTGSLKT